jgi:hypothetical protein
MPTKTTGTLQELMEILIKDISSWTPDEKAHLRAKLRRAFSPGTHPKIAYKM